MTLNNGDFEKGGKTVGKNIEVTVLALDSDGKALEVIFFPIYFLFLNSHYIVVIFFLLM